MAIRRAFNGCLGADQVREFYVRLVMTAEIREGRRHPRYADVDCETGYETHSKPK